MARQHKLPDFQDAILARLKQIAPRSDEWGSYEVSRSNAEVLSAIRYVFTTGITPFDDIVGGMPVGRIVEVFGTEGCGKTALALRTAARAQLGHISEVIRDADGNISYRPLEPDEYDVGVLYIDNEQSLDADEKLVFEGQALDINIGRCDTVDMMFKMAEGALDVADARREISNKLQFVAIVVDTIASTSTKRELTAKWGDVDFPRLPAELSKGFSRLVRRINRGNACMVCTNQVRVNYDAARSRGRSSVPQSFEYRSLGGMALKFYASHRVFMHSSPAKYKLRPDAQFSAGLATGFHTVKNRLRMPQRDGRMVLLYDKEQGGFHDPFSILETLILFGFIEVESKEKGTGFVLKFNKNELVPTTFDPVKVQTTLEEDDAKPLPKRGGTKKDPSFRYRAEWPVFYQEHKADVDMLWKAAVHYAFSTPGLNGVTVEDADALTTLEDLET